MQKLLMLFQLPLIFMACESVNTNPRGSGWMHHDGTGMMGYGYGWGGIGMWLLFFVVIIVIYLIVRKQGNGSDIFSTTKETPLEILKKRYAKGKISKEEFDRMKDDIS